jgi:hypothetical protein
VLRATEERKRNHCDSREETWEKVYPASERGAIRMKSDFADAKFERMALLLLIDFLPEVGDRLVVGGSTDRAEGYSRGRVPIRNRG